MNQKRFFQVTGFLAAFLFLASCSTQPVDVTAEIQEANNAFMEAFNSGDMAAVAMKYAENAKLFPENTGIVQGQENIEKFWSGAAEMGVSKAVLTATSATSYGNTAVEEGVYELFAEGEFQIDKGKYIVIWKKVNGEWKLEKDIWNSSNPAQNPMATIATGGVIGFHILNMKLKDGISEKQFEDFFMSDIKPTFDNGFQGTQVFLLKADRGQFQGKYAEIILFNSVADRDKYFPQQGTTSEASDKAFEAVQPVITKFREMADYSTDFTDWIIK